MFRVKLFLCVYVLAQHRQNTLMRCQRYSERDCSIAATKNGVLQWRKWRWRIKLRGKFAFPLKFTCQTEDVFGSRIFLVRGYDNTKIRTETKFILTFRPIYI